MNYSIAALIFILILFSAMILFINIGQRFAVWQEKVFPRKIQAANLATENATFAVLGLIVAFTFATASQRFDERRTLIIEEANAISTAYLRLDLVSKESRDILKNDFREYLDLRINVYKQLPNLDAVYKTIAQSQQLQNIIWQEAIKGCNNTQTSFSCMLLLPSLNNMFDLANKRVSITSIHPPLFIFIFLIGISLLSALLAGYNNASKKSERSIYIISYSLVITITIYLILDMEYPRLGLIRVDTFDQVILNLKESMTPAS